MARFGFPSSLVSEVAHSCPTLCDPMDCSLPGSPIHGIFQARVLEWVAWRTDAFELCWRRLLRVPWTDCKEIQPVHPKGDQSWVFIGRADVETETPIFGPPDWTVKKAGRWRIDAFELWCWRRLLRVPWTARRSNQSILKEISPGCSLEGIKLKLGEGNGTSLQYSCLENPMDGGAW